MSGSAPTAELAREPGSNSGRGPKSDATARAAGTRPSASDARRHVALAPGRAAGSRRLFLQGGIASLGALALGVMDSLARRAESTPENLETTFTVPWNAAEGTHFYDRFIVVNAAGGVAVFASTCSHLGCRINGTEEKQLVCPCHGSRFTLRGEVARGPAQTGLRALPFELDRTRGVLRVTVKSSAS